MSIPLPVGYLIDDFAKRLIDAAADDLEVPASTEEEMGSIGHVQRRSPHHGVRSPPMYSHPPSTLLSPKFLPQPTNQTQHHY